MTEIELTIDKSYIDKKLSYHYKLLRFDEDGGIIVRLKLPQMSCVHSSVAERIFSLENLRNEFKLEEIPWLESEGRLWKINFSILRHMSHEFFGKKNFSGIVEVQPVKSLNHVVFYLNEWADYPVIEFVASKEQLELASTLPSIDEHWLKKLWKATEIKPSLFGVSINLKKLIEESIPNKDAES